MLQHLKLHLQTCGRKGYAGGAEGGVWDSQRVFVTAFVLMCSDKRFGDEWGHPDVVGAGRICRGGDMVSRIMVISGRAEKRQIKVGAAQIVRLKAESKEPQSLTPIDEEEFKPYFKASFKGMGLNVI